MGLTIGRKYNEAAVSFDLYDLIGSYTGPVLILHGDRDPIVPLSYSERAKEVLPDAELKIFLTASPESRARRRLLDLKEKGIEESFEKVLDDIILRDEQDTKRAAAPLKQAEDAVLVDSSELGFDETFAVLCDIVVQRFALDQEDRA